MQSTVTRHSQTFATLLRHYRLGAGLTQEQLAERAEVSQRTISDLERGLTSRPYRETIRLLSEALGLCRVDRVRFEAAARGIRIAEPTGLPFSGEGNPTNLANELNSFIGRDTELRILRELLTDERVRLLTLVGTGGTGKTRLALRVARDVLPLFPDGVFFVSLAPLDEPGLVLPTIASVLGLKENGEQSLQDAVSDHFQDKQALLILDNLERLLAAGPTIKQLLEASAGLQVVVTSRVAFHLYGEHQFPVSPLSVPDLHLPPSLEELSSCDAVALFVARARAVQPGFALTQENAVSVATLCCYLEGLPLAIELAAGRVNQFSPSVLVRRSRSRLTLLTGGPCDLPQRQQTLRNTIDWSYCLLSEREQALLACLAVFAGGWTLEAAEAVCNETGEPNFHTEMASLTDKSLIEQERNEEPRCSMLETIREYALEKLAERGEAENISRRHAEYFARVVTEADWVLRGPQQKEWFERLDAEQDNLRAALSWATEHGHVELALRIAGPLNGYWWSKARFAEGRHWLERLLRQEKGVAGRVQARALLSLGQDAYTQGDFEHAQAYLQESLRLSEEEGDAALRSLVVLDLGIATFNQGDIERGMALLEQAVVAAREAEHSVALNRSLTILSYGLVTAGRIERGLLLAEEAIARARADGNISAVVSLLDTIARARFELGVIAGAQAAWREGLGLARDTGYTYQIPYYLGGLAGVAAYQGDTRRAARLFAAEEEQRLATAAPRPRAETQLRDRDLGVAKERTDEESWQQAWAEGQVMSLERAIDYALEPAQETGDQRSMKRAKA